MVCHDEATRLVGDSAEPPPVIAHIALPLARTSGGIATVINHLAREHAAVGGKSFVVHNREREMPVTQGQLLAVDYRGAAPNGQFTQQELVTDAIYGRLRRIRPFTGEVQVPAALALRRVKPDVIMVHEGQYASSSLPRWREHFPSACIVLYLHTALSRSYGKAELRRLLNRADVVVCVSNFMADYLRTRAPRLKAPVRVVCNGTVIGPPHDAAGTPKTPVIQFVGKVDPHKGVHLLVEAATQLLAAGHDLRVRIVGSAILAPAALSPYERFLREMAAPFTDRFEWIPFVPHEQLDPLYRSTDVACVPSQVDESCGGTLLEALGYGLPTVISRRGGLPEVGADAVLGFDDTPTDLSRALLDAFAQSDRLSACATRRATELSWPSQYLLLRRYLSGSRPATR